MQILNFRCALGSLTSDLLDVMALGPFEKFDKRDYRTWRGEHKDFSVDSSIRSSINAVLPLPYHSEEGMMWQKPLQYLMCACAARRLGVHEVEDRLVAALPHIKSIRLGRTHQSKMDIEPNSDYLADEDGRRRNFVGRLRASRLPKV